jgi:hypothetical protein
MSSMNDGLSQEDAVIQKVLTQILSQELGGEENIDYPEYYEREATKAEVQLPEDGNYYNK